MIALRHDPSWQNVIGFDEMRQRIMRLQPIPVFESNQPSDDHHVGLWTDTDDAATQEWLQLAGLRNVATTTVVQAISKRASEQSYHQLREWLAQLTWDGVPRIIGGVTDQGEIIDPWLVTYLGAAESKYVRAVGDMWKISAVARIFEPGCKVDHTLILEGPQGSGKSTACKTLCGETYFSDVLPNIETKDGALHLTGKWFIELSELDAMSRADTAPIKAFLSRTIDRYRPPYGRREVDVPRQCVFIGTTNKQDYLKDETGGRRFWPVKIGAIDLEALTRDREQLWAEAVARYCSGQRWHITDPELIAAARQEQEARYDSDVWEDSMPDFLLDKQEVTVNQVLMGLGFDTQRMDRASQNRVTRILTKLGWVRGKRTAKARYWMPPTPDADSDVTE
jgi:predicted P-loop ATPase